MDGGHGLPEAGLPETSLFALVGILISLSILNNEFGI